MSNLSKRYQERLENWQSSRSAANAKPPKPYQSSPQLNYVARKEWGDDIEDWEKKKDSGTDQIFKATWGL